MKKQFVSKLTASALAVMIVSGFFATAGTSFAAGEVTTNAATGITTNDATLNGTNGPADADGHSFWVSTSTFSTASPTIPPGVYSTPDLGAIASSTAFSAALSSLTTSGVPSNMPAITASTTYYFAAWVNVGGTWFPGDVLNFTTSPPAPPVAHPDTYADNAAGNDSNDCLTPATACKTITAALAAVDANGTVHVAAGTYAEHVVVGKTVALKGANAGIAGTATRSAESIVDGSGTDAPFAIAADNVTIDGFTVQAGQGGSYNSGIHTTNANTGYTIENNVIRDNVMGLYLNTSSATTTTSTTVTGNLFNNNNREGAASGNGIYSDQGLQNVTISGNTFTGAHSNSSIILVSDVSKNITITGNHLTNDNEILLTNTDGASITGNTITNSLFHGIQLGGGNNNVTITGNTITGNVTFPTASAIRVNGGPVNSNVSISNNSLTGNHYGVNVTATSASNVTAHFNDLTNNLISLYYGDSVSPIDVVNNWWGCAAGPTATTTESLPSATSTCGLISEDVPASVTFSPWLATLQLNGNNPVVASIMNSASSTVGGNTGLKVKFSSTGANATGSSTVAIGGDNTASYAINGSGPNSGDTTVNGMVLFADQDSTLTNSLVIAGPSSSGGSGSSGSGSRSTVKSGSGGGGTTGQVLGASTSTVDTTSVVSTTTPPTPIFVCTDLPYINSYMRRGQRNDPAEVMKLQNFLNRYMFSGLPVTGFFGPLTDAAVRAFQVRYSEQILAPWGITQPTGYVFKTTRWWINYISCSNTAGPQPIVQ
jgi:parallel beta-helix repeat protein